LGEPEDDCGQADKKKGGSTGGTDGIWNLVLRGSVKNQSLFYSTIMAIQPISILMLFIFWRIRIITWRNSVFATDFPVHPFNG